MRAETGPIAFGEDWAGLFVRGQDALMHYAPALRAVLRAALASPAFEAEHAQPLAVLKELVEALGGVEHSEGEPRGTQKLAEYGLCLPQGPVPCEACVRDRERARGAVAKTVERATLMHPKGTVFVCDAHRDHYGVPGLVPVRPEHTPMAGSKCYECSKGRLTYRPRPDNHWDGGDGKQRPMHEAMLVLGCDACGDYSLDAYESSALTAHALVDADASLEVSCAAFRAAWIVLRHPGARVAALPPAGYVFMLDGIAQPPGAIVPEVLRKVEIQRESAPSRAGGESPR